MGNKQGNQNKGNAKSVNKEERKREQDEKKLQKKEEKVKKKQETKSNKKSTKKSKEKQPQGSGAQTTSGSEFDDFDAEYASSSHFEGAEDSESGVFHSAENISTVSPYLDSCTRSERDKNSGIWGSCSPAYRHPQVLSSRDFRDGFSLEACIPPEIARPITYTTTDTSISSGGAVGGDCTNPSSIAYRCRDTSSGSLKSKKSNNSSVRSHHHTPTFSLRRHHHHHNNHQQQHHRHQNDDDLSVSTSSSQKSDHGVGTGGYSTPLLNTPVFGRADRLIIPHTSQDMSSPDKDIVEFTPTLPYSSFDPEVKVFTTYNPTIISKNNAQQHQQQKQSQYHHDHSYFQQPVIDYRKLPKPTSPHPQRRAFSPKMTSSPFKIISSDDSSSSPTTPIPQRKAAGLLSDLFSRSSSKKKKNKEFDNKNGDNNRGLVDLEEESPKHKRKPIWKTWERSSRKISNSSENARNSIFGTARKTEKAKESPKEKLSPKESNKNKHTSERLSDCTLKNFETNESSENRTDVLQEEHSKSNRSRNDKTVQGSQTAKGNANDMFDKNSSDTQSVEMRKKVDENQLSIRYEFDGTYCDNLNQNNRNSSPPVAKSTAFCIMRLEELERNIEKTIREKFPDAEQFLLRTRTPPDEAEVIRGSKSLPTTPSLKKKIFVTRDLDKSRDDVICPNLEQLSAKLEKLVGATRYCEETFEDGSSRAKSPVIVRRFGTRTRHASISPKVHRAKMAAIYKSPSEMERMTSFNEEETGASASNNNVFDKSSNVDRYRNNNMISLSHITNVKQKPKNDDDRYFNELFTAQQKQTTKPITTFSFASSPSSSIQATNTISSTTTSRNGMGFETTNSIGTSRVLVRQQRIDDSEFRVEQKIQSNISSFTSTSKELTDSKEENVIVKSESAVFGSVSPKLKRSIMISKPCDNENSICSSTQETSTRLYHIPLQSNNKIPEHSRTYSSESKGHFSSSHIDYDDSLDKNNSQLTDQRNVVNIKTNNKIKRRSGSLDSFLYTTKVCGEFHESCSKTPSGVQTQMKPEIDNQDNSSKQTLPLVITTDPNKSSDPSQAMPPKISVRSMVKSINKSLSEDIERSECHKYIGGRVRGRGRERNERGRGRGSGSSIDEEVGYTSLPTSPLQQRFKFESRSNEGDKTLQSSCYNNDRDDKNVDRLDFYEGSDFTQDGYTGNRVRKETMKLEIEAANSNNNTNTNWRNASNVNCGSSNLGTFNYGFISPTSPRRQDSSIDQRVVFGAAVALPCRIYASSVSPNRTSNSSNTDDNSRKNSTEKYPSPPLLSPNSMRCISSCSSSNQGDMIVYQSDERGVRKGLKFDNKCDVDCACHDQKSIENKHSDRRINNSGRIPEIREDMGGVSLRNVNPDFKPANLSGEREYKQHSGIVSRNAARVYDERTHVDIGEGKRDEKSKCYRYEDDKSDNTRGQRDKDYAEKSRIVCKGELKDRNNSNLKPGFAARNENVICSKNRNNDNYTSTGTTITFSGGSQVGNILERTDGVEVVDKEGKNNRKDGGRRIDSCSSGEDGGRGRYHDDSIVRMRDGEGAERCIEYYDVTDGVQMSDSVSMGFANTSSDRNQNTQHCALSGIRDVYGSYSSSRNDLKQGKDYGVLSVDIRSDDENIFRDKSDNNTFRDNDKNVISRNEGNFQWDVYSNYRKCDSKSKSSCSGGFETVSRNLESDVSININRVQGRQLHNISAYSREESNEDIDEVGLKERDPAISQTAVLKLPISKIIFDMINTSKTQSPEKEQQQQQKQKQQKQDHQSYPTIDNQRQISDSIELSNSQDSTLESKYKNSLVFEPVVAMVTTPSYEQPDTMLEEGTILSSQHGEFTQQPQDHQQQSSSPLSFSLPPQQAAKHFTVEQSLTQTDDAKMVDDHGTTETQNTNQRKKPTNSTTTTQLAPQFHSDCLTKSAELRGSMILSSTETGESGDDSDMTKFIQSLQQSTSQFGPKTQGGAIGGKGKGSVGTQDNADLFVTEDFVRLSPPPPSPNALDKLIDAFREEDEDFDDDFGDIDDVDPSYSLRGKIIGNDDGVGGNTLKQKSSDDTVTGDEDNENMSVIMRDNEMKEFADKVMNRLSDLLGNISAESCCKFSDEGDDDHYHDDDDDDDDDEDDDDEIEGKFDEARGGVDVLISRKTKFKTSEQTSSNQNIEKDVKTMSGFDEYVKEHEQNIEKEKKDLEMGGCSQEEEVECSYDDTLYDDDNIIDGDDNNKLLDDFDDDNDNGMKKPPIPKERILYSRFSTSSSLSTSTSSTSSSSGLFAPPPPPLDSPSIPKPSSRMVGFEGIEGAPKFKNEPDFFVFPERLIMKQKTIPANSQPTSSAYSRNKQHHGQENPYMYQQLETSRRMGEKYNDDDGEDGDDNQNRSNCRDNSRRSAQTRSYHSDDDVARGGGIPEYYDDHSLWRRQQKTPGQMSAKVASQRRRERRERWLRKRQRNKTDLISNASSEVGSEQSPKDDGGSRLSLNDFDDDDEEFVSERTNLVSRINQKGALGSGILSSPKYSKPIMPFLGSREKIPPHDSVEVQETFRQENDSLLKCSSIPPSRFGVRVEEDQNSDNGEEVTCIDDISEHKVEAIYGDSRDLSSNGENDDGMRRLQRAGGVSIPGLEETFEELKSVQCLLEGLQGKPPRSRSKRHGDRKGVDKDKAAQHSNTSESQRDSKSTKLLPLTVENIRSIKEQYREKDNSGRLSRLSNTNRTESDLDIYSEHRDDMSTDSNLYADDEGDDDDYDEIGNDAYTTAEDELDTSLGDADLDNFVVGYTFYNSKTYEQRSRLTPQNDTKNSECSDNSGSINTVINPIVFSGNTSHQSDRELTLLPLNPNVDHQSSNLREGDKNNGDKGGDVDNGNNSNIIVDRNDFTSENPNPVLFSSHTDLNRTITITNTNQRPNILVLSSTTQSTSTTSATNTTSTTRNDGDYNFHITSSQNTNHPRNSGYVRSNSDPGAFFGHQLSVSTANFRDSTTQGSTSDEEFWAGRGAAFNASRSYPTDPHHQQNPQQQQQQQQQHQNHPQHHPRLLQFHSAPASTDAGAASGGVSSTFQNAREQMMDIQQHLQALRRQMEGLEEELSSTTSTSYTLTPDFSAYDSK